MVHYGHDQLSSEGVWAGSKLPSDQRQSQCLLVFLGLKQCFCNHQIFFHLPSKLHPELTQRSSQSSDLSKPLQAHNTASSQFQSQVTIFSTCQYKSAPIHVTMKLHRFVFIFDLNTSGEAQRPFGEESQVSAYNWPNYRPQMHVAAEQRVRKQMEHHSPVLVLNKGYVHTAA